MTFKKTNIVIIILLALITSSYGQDRFELVGTIDPKFNGGYVKLFSKYSNLSSSLRSEIKGGKFHFQEEIDNEFEQALMEVWIEGKVYELVFFITAKKMQIDIKSLHANPSENVITYTNIPFIQLQEEYNQRLSEAKGLTIRKGTDSSYLSRAEKRKVLLETKLAFIKSHPDSYFSLYQFSAIIDNPTLQPDSLYSIFVMLSESLKSNPKGRLLEDKLTRKMALVINKVIPDISFRLRDGKEYRVSQFRDSQFVLLCFWASWCGPCKENIPFLREVSVRYKKLGLQLISVSIDDDESKWINDLKRYPMPWLQTLDLQKYVPKMRVRDVYSLTVIPQYFLIDKKGRLIYHNFQMNDDDDYTLLKGKLKELFGESMLQK